MASTVEENQKMEYNTMSKMDPSKAKKFRNTYKHLDSMRIFFPQQQ